MYICIPVYMYGGCMYVLLNRMGAQCVYLVLPDELYHVGWVQGLSNNVYKGTKRGDGGKYRKYLCTLDLQ